jgi:hypothetical protein
MIGRMKQPIKLLGTSLELLKGQRVEMFEALNVPGGGYFLKPVGGLWSDGIEHNEDDSILVDPSEVDDYLEIVEP